MSDGVRRHREAVRSRPEHGWGSGFAGGIPAEQLAHLGMVGSLWSIVFYLRKWYCDLTDDAGTVFIGYRSTLAWGVVRLSHASHILSARNGREVSRDTLRAGVEPQEEGGTMRWICRGMHVEGSWRRRTGGITIRLLDAPEGLVEWQCVMPAADAEVRVNGEEFRGLGYVECLTMTMPPWRLPCDELRWGRALAPGRSTVWIDWKGGQGQRWAVSDGLLLPATACSDGGLELGDGRSLTLGHRRTIRDGTIGEVLSTIPGLGSLVPRRVRNARETKWLSRADWSDGTAGWSIHEVVRWA